MSDLPFLGRALLVIGTGAALNTWAFGPRAAISFVIGGASVLAFLVLEAWLWRRSVAKQGLRACAHCGATDVGSLAAGSAAVGMQPVCHPYNTGPRMDCYSLVTLYRHPMPCAACNELNWPHV